MNFNGVIGESHLKIQQSNQPEENKNADKRHGISYNKKQLMNTYLVISYQWLHEHKNSWKILFSISCIN